MLLLLALALAVLVLPADALAMPPTLRAVGQQDRHLVAILAAPGAFGATIYVASKPDRATDGRFLDENIKTLDFLTDSEIQSGRWVYEDQIDPGTYYVLLRTDCYTTESDCADGFSNMMTVVVPKPVSRYTAAVTAYRYLDYVSLQVVARPLGERRAYRACYRLRSGRTRCLTGTLDGYDWNSSADDRLTVSTRGLPLRTTFSWYVGGKLVAAKRVLIRR
jgi:hypothetical protein